MKKVKVLAIIIAGLAVVNYSSLTLAQAKKKKSNQTVTVSKKSVREIKGKILFY
ncbi:MAG: hypothetical protein V1872_03995 [bacterium]